MKQNYYLASIACLLSVFIISCSKNKDSNDTDISQKIQNIISIKTLDSLESIGLKINRGNKPPNIEGIFLMNPTTLTVRYGPADSYEVGKVIEDYKVNFYDQVNDDVKLDYKNSINTDKGTGLGSFISGSDNKFTLFAQLTSVSSGISNKSVFIISGEISDAGVKDFQLALILTEKDGDDANAILIPEGAGRIYKDGNNLADKTDNYNFSYSGKSEKRLLFGN